MQINTDIAPEIIRKWNDILELTSLRTDRPVVLAGGAVRDVVLGKPECVKDYDVFMPDGGSWGERYHGALRGDVVCVNYGDGAFRREITKVIKTRTGLGDHIDMVFVDRDCQSIEDFARTCMEDFDWGLCKIAYTRETGLIVHPHFRRDALSRTLTLHACEGTRSLERSIAKAGKLWERYGITAVKVSSELPLVTPVGELEGLEDLVWE